MSLSLKKPKIYDIENFSTSYSYSEATNESYVVEKDIRQSVDASANYAFKFEQIEVKPFAKIGFLKNKNLSILRDINFNLLPSDIAINSSVKRNHSEYKYRDISEVVGVEIPTLKQRNFLFDWDYRIGYKLTDAINLNFNARNNHIYDSFEREAEADELDKIDVFSDFLDTGRASNYSQDVTATYKLPINKIPFLSFISSDYSYTGNFEWVGASPDFENEIGNTIQNGNTHNISTNLNFSKLYSKIGLQKLFKSSPKRKSVKSIRRTRKKKKTVGDFMYNLLSSVKTARLSYNKNQSSSLGGYAPEVGFLGRNKFNGGYAPSLGYVFGKQINILQEALENDWLVRGEDSEVIYNKNYKQTEFTSLNYDVTVKPIQDLNIQLTGTRAYSETSQQQHNFIENATDAADVLALNNSVVNQYGNYKISYSLIKTAMGSNSATLFNTFLANRSKIVGQILTGYSGDLNSSQALNSQEVLIHSFLAAYSGKDAVSSNKTIFRDIPIPNWNITYRGLMKIGFVKKNFKSFTLSHGYNSSYTINNFSNNLDSSQSELYPSGLIYSGVTLVDALSPLIKLDVKFKNSLSFRGTVNTNRVLSLNLNNTTLSEIEGREYVFGLGYRFKDVKLKTRFLGKKKVLKGDINVKADVSYKTDVTNVRNIDTGTSQVVGGQNLLGIKIAADYNLSRKFTATFYYDQNVASYAISTLYPRESINTGISLVYNLGN